MHTLLPPSEHVVKERADVRITFALVFSILGRVWPPYPFELGPQPAEVLSRDRALAVEWTNLDLGHAHRLIKDGRLRANPIKQWEGGLDRILSALEYMQEGMVRGVKLVHHIP